MSNQNSNGNNRGQNSSNQQQMNNRSNNNGQIRNQTQSESQYLSNLKEESAKELGINLKDPELTAKEAGKVGGDMVKHLVEKAKQNAEKL